MDETAVSQRAATFDQVYTPSVMIQEVIHDREREGLTFNFLAVGNWDISILTQRTKLDLERRNVHIFILYTGSGSFALISQTGTIL